MGEFEDFGFYIKKINDTLVAQANAQFKRLDITYAQMEVMFFLLGQAGMWATQKDIEAHFHLKHSSVIGLLQRMRAKGLIEVRVNPQDHRGRDVFLLDKALKIRDEMYRTRQEVEAHITNYLTREQMEQLTGLLAVFYSAIRNREEEPQARPDVGNLESL